MRIIRIIRVLGTCMMIGAFFVIGHSYHSTMNAPAGGDQGARFVSNSGQEISRQDVGQPTMVDSMKLFWANLTGKETKPTNGLKALQSRTAIALAPAPDSVEGVIRETEFWTNFTSKMGFTGP